MEFLRVLVLSTRHVATEDLERLEVAADEVTPGIVAGRDPFGVWIWAPDDEEALADLQRDGYTDSLTKALRFTRAHGASHLRLDCDVDALETQELDCHDA